MPSLTAERITDTASIETITGIDLLPPVPDSTSTVVERREDPAALGMAYFDTYPLPPGVTEDKYGDLTYRPAELIFNDEASHHVGAEAVRAVLGEANIYNQMQRQLVEPVEVLDPKSLPDGVPEVLGRSIYYEQHRYDLQYARRIREAIGIVAGYHWQPETRPSHVTEALAASAAALDESAPGQGEAPRNDEEKVLEIALRRPKQQAELAAEKILAFYSA